MSGQRSALATYVLGGGGVLLGSIVLGASLVLTSVLSQAQTMEQMQAEAVAISEQSGAFTTDLYRASAELLTFVATGQRKDQDDARQELHEARRLAAALREHDIRLAALAATPLTDEQAQLHRQRLAIVQQIEASEHLLREATVTEEVGSVSPYPRRTPLRRALQDNHRCRQRSTVPEGEDQIWRGYVIRQHLLLSVS